MSVCLPALTLAAAPALGQTAEDDREAQKSVFERTRVDYDSLGLHRGSFFFYPSIEISETYDDNVLAADANTDSDFVTTLSPEFAVEGDLGNWRVDGSVGGAFSFHINEPDEDKQDLTARARVRGQVGGAGQVVGRAFFLRRKEGRDSPEVAGDRSDIDRYGAVLGYFYRPNKLGFGVRARIQQVNFSETTDDDRDRNDFLLAPEVSWRRSETLTGYIRPSYQLTDVDSSTDRNGLDRDRESVGGQAGAELQIGEKMSVELFLGVDYLMFDEATFDDQAVFTVGGAFDWNVTRQLSVSVGVAREPRATTQARSPIRTDTELNLRLEYALRDNILVAAEAAFEEQDFQDISRTDDRYRFGLDLRYLLNRRVHLYGEYRLDIRDSTVAGEDFTRNRIGVGLRLQL